jgi:hypothetical protein
MRRRLLVGLGLLLLISAGVMMILLTDHQAIELPYDNSNPVVYDNDSTADVYTDDYVMALASAGDINLVGMITTASVGYEQKISDRRRGVAHARNSGFRDIPDPVRGVKGRLREPTSGRIADTQPIGSKGSWLIVNEATETEKALVIVAGGPLSTVADAYLLDNSIADKVIVAWLANGEGMSGYNGWADPWAAYIVLEKLRLVQFPAGSLKPLWKDHLNMLLHKVPFIQLSTDATPYVPKSRLATLRETPLRDWMVNKHHPANGMPGDMDGDAPPAVSVMRSDYARGAKRVSFSHWTTKHGREVALYKDDPKGAAIVIENARKDVATEEWWRALQDPAAYRGSPN